MSYSLKYFGTLKGQSTNEWRVELLQKDYIGDSVRLLFMGDGIRIGYDREEDRFAPIISRYATITIKATDSFNINTIQTDDEREFQVIIKKNNTVEFVGWLTPFSSSQDYEDISAVVIDITAKDTINQLSNVDFFNQYPERPNNRQSFKEVISLGLKQLGYLLDLQIYYNKYASAMSKGSTDCPLSQLYFDVTALQDKDGVWLDFYTIIKRLLIQHDLRLFQSRGKWIIISPIELTDGTVTGRVFEPENGFYMSTVTLNSDKIIGLTGLRVLKTAKERKAAPIHSYTGVFNYGLSVNLVPNGSLTRFTEGVPDNWSLGGDWSEGEITDIIGGGVMIDRTYIRKVGSQIPTETSPDPVFEKSQYLISDQIDISSLSTFKFKAEAYGDDDIDELRVMVRITDVSTGGKVYYVDNNGKVYSSPTSIFIQKGETDKSFSINVEWNKLDSSFEFGLRNATILEILLYPGVRYRTGAPSNQHVKFRNLQLTGTPYAFDANYVGRKYEYSNTSLPKSKKTEPYNLYFQDVEGYDLSAYQLRSGLFVSETGSRAHNWKRTTETTNRTIIESNLVDRLSLTSRFGDIFEGKVRGEVEFINTPFFLLSNKRYLIIHAEYNLQQHETDLYLTELFSNNISFSFRKIDLFKDGKEIDVSDGINTSSLGAGEKLDTPITSTGDSAKYGGLFTDGGIDSLPNDTTDPKASNKGVLKIGFLNALKVLIGNVGSFTEVLGKLGIKNSGGFLSEFDTSGHTADRLIGFPDRDIVVNDWDYIVGVPETFPPDAGFFLFQDTITGNKDGINTEFQTSQNFVSGTTQVYINGVRQYRGATEDYRELNSNTIEIFDPPVSTDKIIIDYIRA